MNKPFVLSAVMVLSAGGVLFVQQTNRLEEVRRNSRTAVVLESAPAKPARVWTPPPAKRPEPEGRLLDRLSERLIDSLSVAQMTEFLASGERLKASRMATAAGLNAQEREALEGKFAFFAGEKAALLKRKGLSDAERSAASQDLEKRKSDWVADQLGQERLAQVEVAKKAFARAGVERDAARLVSRISNAADMTTDQKDRLYATLVERAQGTASGAAGDPAMKLHISGSVTEEPGVPDIAGEARAILTPGQWALYEQSRALSAQQVEASLDALKGMAPTAILTLQEVLAETNPAAPENSGKKQ